MIVHAHSSQNDTNSETSAQIEKKKASNIAYSVDSRGHIQSTPGLTINNRYKVIKPIGSGQFSKVFEVNNIENNTNYALKIVRNLDRFIEASKNEVKILKTISKFNNEASECYDLMEYFTWNQHPCFIFRLFGLNIYEIQKINNFKPFPNAIIRSLTYQICHVMEFLHNLDIIFTDIKPENFVFVSRCISDRKINKKTFLFPINTQIKLIDFGSAVSIPKDPNSEAAQLYRYHNGFTQLITTRHYRAPEVILGIPWKKPVDIWSIGCLLLEFISGRHIFSTHCPIDHLNQIQTVIGDIPKELILACSDRKHRLLFDEYESLKFENAKISNIQSKPLENYFHFKQMGEHQQLYNLIESCLKWKSLERITADKLLKHEYFPIIEKFLTHDHLLVN